MITSRHTDAVVQSVAHILTDALPYIRRYIGKTIVIKFGGAAMVNSSLAKSFGRDVALLKFVGINPVIIHGGGPQINAMLERLNIKSHFVKGLRATTVEAMDIIEMVLAGQVNKHIAAMISQAGARAIGISGKDGYMITVQKKSCTDTDAQGHTRDVDLGFVGEPEHIDTRVIFSLSGAGLIPVIAPIGSDNKGQSYNINADVAAGAIASALKATRLLMLTDVEGVMDETGRIVTDLTISDVERGIENGAITGGMIPKVETCCRAVSSGVDGVVILDGRVKHACLLELFTETGLGTIIHSHKRGYKGELPWQDN